MSQPEPGISKTALWVAAARAVGAREPDPKARNPDSLAEPLLGDLARFGLDHPVFDALQKPYDEAMQEIEVASMVRSMAERTHFIDEALRRAVSNGATQVLVVGAGLDSHAWRCRELLANTRVFEFDRPGTSAFKQRRVEEALGGPPANLNYVAADLEHEALPDALARHGYDASRRTFVIMEGVSMYVAERPLRATFRYFATHAPGSSVVFDFATRTMIEGMRVMDLEKIPAQARAPFERIKKLIEHEPWVFGIPLDGEKEFLAGVGLELRDMITIGSEESVRRHITRADGTALGAEAHARALAYTERIRQQMLDKVEPEKRAFAEAAMRDQARQNAYRMAEACVARQSTRST